MSLSHLLIDSVSDATSGEHSPLAIAVYKQSKLGFITLLGAAHTHTMYIST